MEYIEHYDLWGDQIIQRQHLVNMWQKLQFEGLIFEGMSFEMFCAHARDQLILARKKDE